MRWLRQGVVLPAPVGRDWAVSHAALPTVERVDGSRVSLLFSGRDAQGRASIARARVDLDGGQPVVDATPLLRPGRLGTFDADGVTVSCVVEHDGLVFLYYTGWTRGVSVPFGLFAGLALSRDGGRTFARKNEAPLLERSRVDPLLTASPWVLRDDGRWRMWYVSATEWEMVDDAPRHRYHIRYAESDDGFVWEREGRVAVDFAGPHEFALSRPCVIRDGDMYRMWFSARGDAYSLHEAESPDGLTWTRSAVELVGGGEWDGEMQAYPVVLDQGGRRLLLYNGNGYGRTGIGAAEAVS